MSKRDRKKNTPQQPAIHPWFPKSVDKELIPAICALGQSGISVADTEPTSTGLSVKISFGKKPQAPKEKLASQSLDDTLLFGLATVLANGPKLFVIPPDIIDDLNQVEIPLKVADYEQPFPGVIVKNGAEYHIVFQLNGRLFCVTEWNGFVDSCSFLDLGASIESYLSADHSFATFQIDAKRSVQYKLPVNVNTEHRYRATLNFLLMIMSGGFVEVHATTKVRSRTYVNVIPKYSTPQTFKPQDIALWRTRLINATQRNEVPGSMGGKKRTHWRRAHWRRVAVGVGRMEREFRLISACMVNKQLLATSASLCDSKYTVS